ncbi:MAG: KH domain-containing protein [Clostridia bacterium]|nr:KH domain-containing protein [Clostridia bacterium]
MKDLLIALAQSLVEKPDEVSVEEQVAEDGTVVFYLRVADGDMGRVIGKQGRIAKAIRTLLRAAATREDKKVSVEIVD